MSGVGGDWLAPGILPRAESKCVIIQDDWTKDMRFDIARQIEFISSNAAMPSGDTVCPRSRVGNGVIRDRFLAAGSVIEASIEGLRTQYVKCLEFESES
jgi:2,4-didehydro-3-deoxy-L-rhamnonate hydrolase